jgi:hypothetical protein
MKNGKSLPPSVGMGGSSSAIDALTTETGCNRVREHPP